MWKINSRKTVYQAGPVKLDELDAIDPNGGNKKRISMSVGGDSVLIIPRFQDLEFLLGKQYRVGEEREVIEFPNGGIEPGENPLDAAIRELNEELGYTGEFTYLGSFTPLVGLVDLNVHVYLCSNLTPVNDKIQPDSYESIQPIRLSSSQLENMIKSGEVFDAYTLSSYMLYKIQ